MYSILASTLLLSAAGTANAAAVDNRAALTARGDAEWPLVWEAPEDGGKTRVRFSDQNVYVGGCTPESVLDSLGENCYEDGYCNPEEWTMQCVQGDKATHTITMKAPEGQYLGDLRNGLVDALKAAIMTDKVTSSKPIYAQSGGGCVGCTWTTEEITVYTMPSYVGISRANDDDVPDVITMTITNNDSDEDAGLCEILTGIGGAIAGAVNGAAGGIFGVAGIACKGI